MSRKHKKRNKPYTGSDAADAPVHVTRYKAEVRSPLGQWWFDHKKRVRIGAMVGGGAVVVGWLLFEFFNLVF